MLHDIVKKGSTDRSVSLRIIDNADGTPETGVVFNTAGIALWYRREGAAKTDITEATLAALTTAHTDGGFLHIGDGVYRLDLPDAAFATGANYVDFGGTVTGMIVIGGRVRLVDYSLEDGVRMGLTALPNAAAEAAGGLYTRGAGSGQINQGANGQVDVNLVTWRSTQPITLQSGRVEALAGAVNTDAIVATSFATGALDAVWATTTRVLTAGTNIVLAKGTGVTGLNDLDAAGVRAAVGLATANLDTQLTAIDDFLDTEVAAIKAKTDTLPTDPADQSLIIAATDAVMARLGAPVGASMSADLAAVKAQTAAIEVDTAVIGAAGAGLTALPWNAAWDAEVQSECADALAAYDPPTKAELDAAVAPLATAAALSTVDDLLDTEVTAIKDVTDKLNTALELDGAVYRLTTNALELAPTGGSAPTAVAIANEVQTRTIAAVTVVNGLAANVVTASALAADAVTEMQAGLATAASVAALNNISAAQVNAEVDTALLDVGLTAVVTGRIDAAVSTRLASAGYTAPDNATITAIAGYVDTEVAAIKAKTDLIPAAPAAVGDIPSAAAIADAVHDEVVEGTTTLRQSVRLANAALGGKASGLATTTAIYRDLADSKDRITATVDADGNRTAVTRDMS